MSMRLFISLFCLLVIGIGALGCASKSEYSGYSSAPAYQGANGLYGGAQAESMQASYNVDAVRVQPASAPTRVLAQRDSSGGPATDAQKIEAQRASADKSQATIERKLIRNAWMTLEVNDEDDFPTHIKTFHKIAESLKGYVQSESSTTITMMVPTERIDDALKQIAGEGKVTYKNISVVDATSNYVDMQIRIENLRKMRIRLTELVNQSTSVKEVLEVERELSRVTSELERIEGQMRLLSQQTSYATINVTLEERVKPGPLGWIFYGIGKGVKWLFIRN